MNRYQSTIFGTIFAKIDSQFSYIGIPVVGLQDNNHYICVYCDYHQPLEY